MEELKKKRSKLLIILISAMVIFMIVFVAGGCMTEDKNIAVAGWIIFSIGMLLFIVTTILLIYFGLKINKEINKLEDSSILEYLTKKDGKKEFKSEEGIDVVFSNQSIFINGIEHILDTVTLISFVKYDRKGFNLNLVPVLVIVYDENKELIIKIDGDLLENLESNNINIENKDDLAYYLSNIEKCNKTVRRLFSFHPTPYAPMIFAKNQEEKKVIAKRNTISIIIAIIMILAVIAINVGLIWMADSEQGIKFSDNIGLSSIVKIVFSLIILVTTFVKGKNVKLQFKLFSVTYVILYWITILLLTGRETMTLSVIFAIGFAIIGYFQTKENNKDIEDEVVRKNNFFNRFYGYAVFNFLIIALSVFDVAYKNENLWIIVCAVSAIFISIIISVISLLNYVKSEKIIQSKPKRYLMYFGMYLCIYICSFMLAWGFILPLNISLDYSKPIYSEHEIIDKEQGDDNSNDCVTIILDGKEVEIPIEDSDYYKYNIGDTIVIRYYKGAFGIDYYKYDSNK